MFVFQQEGFVPDVLVLGKALGGSITPISATMASRDLVDRAYGSVERFDLHSSTFAGNSFGCAAALETLAIVEDEHLAERARTMGDELISALKKRLAGHPFVREIRGRGLLIGVELGPTQTGIVSRLAPGLVRLVAKRVLGQWLSVRLLERGILAQPAAQEWDVLKLEPPLIVQQAELTRVVDEVGAILDEYRELPALLSDVTARLGAQLIDGWRFR
jgi:putrescine aminotransferase